MLLLLLLLLLLLVLGLADFHSGDSFFCVLLFLDRRSATSASNRFRPAERVRAATSRCSTSSSSSTAMASPWAIGEEAFRNKQRTASIYDFTPMKACSAAKPRPLRHPHDPSRPSHYWFLLRSSTSCWVVGVSSSLPLLSFFRCCSFVFFRFVFVFVSSIPRCLCAVCLAVSSLVVWVLHRRRASLRFRTPRRNRNQKKEKRTETKTKTATTKRNRQQETTGNLGLTSPSQSTTSSTPTPRSHYVDWNESRSWEKYISGSLFLEHRPYYETDESQWRKRKRRGRETADDSTHNQPKKKQTKNKRRPSGSPSFFCDAPLMFTVLRWVSSTPPLCFFSSFSSSSCLSFFSDHQNTTLWQWRTLTKKRFKKVDPCFFLFW